MGILSGLFGGGSQTQKTKPVISTRAQDLLDPAMSSYEALFKNQMGIGQTAQNQQMAETAQGNALNPWQRQGLQAQVDHAHQGMALGQGAQNAITGLFQNGGLNQQQGQLAQGLTGGQFVNPATGTVGDIASGAQNGQNPYLDATFGQAAHNYMQQVVPAMTGQAASAGRLGSTAYANALGQQVNSGLGQLATNIYGQGYQTDRSNQMQALGMQGQLGQQDVANRIAGSGLYDQGTARQLGAVGLGGTAYALGSQPGQDLYAAGTTKQQAPFQLAAQAAGVAEGYPVGQSSTQSSQMNPLTGLLGLGASGAQLGAMFGGFGPAAQGAALMSDRRLKTKVRKVGSLPIFDWQYRGDPSGETHRGPMAQDVAEVMPEKVGRGPGGYLTIPSAMVR